MSNKNDFSDLISFFTGIATVFFVVVLLLFIGFSRIDKKYINMLNAKLSEYQEYIDQQWDSGIKTSPPPKMLKDDFIPW